MIMPFNGTGSGTIIGNLGGIPFSLVISTMAMPERTISRV